MITVHAVHVVHGFSVNGMNKILFPSVLLTYSRMIGNKIGNLISRAIKNPPAREVRSTVGKLLKLRLEPTKSIKFRAAVISAVK